MVNQLRKLLKLHMTGLAVMYSRRAREKSLNDISGSKIFRLIPYLPVHPFPILEISSFFSLSVLKLIQEFV